MRATKTAPAVARPLAIPSMIEAVLPGLIFACLVSVTVQWWTAYQFDSDEGINLAKAALVAEGYDLYADIWNDQPPLLTYALTAVHELTGGSVAWARALILLFAAILLNALFAIVRHGHGRAAAWFSVVLLCGTTFFAGLAVSVMVGLPAIALAIVALQVLLTGSEPGPKRLLLAGAVFAVSLQVKFFTFLVVPALLVAAIWPDRFDFWKAVRRLAWLLIGLSLASLAIILIANVPVIDQLIEPHVDDDLRTTHGFAGSALDVLADLAENFWIVFLGAAGAVFCLRQRAGNGIVLLVWAGVSAVAFMFHTPIHYHHALMYFVPLAGLAGIQAERLRKALWLDHRRWRWKVAAGLGALLVVAGYIIAIPYQSGGPAWAVTREISKQGDAPDWVISDFPIDAYQAGALVPPELAVYSKKRLNAGNLTAGLVIEAIETYRPQYVIFRRFDPLESVVDHLAARYEPVEIGVEGSFYRRRASAD